MPFPSSLRRSCLTSSFSSTPLLISCSRLPLFACQNGIRAFRSKVKNGTLLAIVGLDFDRNLIPLAFSHAREDCEQDWRAFLEWFCDCAPDYEPLQRARREPFSGGTDALGDGAPVAVITDLSPGLKKAIAEVMPSAHPLYCVVHRAVRCCSVLHARHLPTFVGSPVCGYAVLHCPCSTAYTLHFCTVLSCSFLVTCRFWTVSAILNQSLPGLYPGLH